MIANAGIADRDAYRPLAQQSAEVLLRHYNVNTLGPLFLFQGTLALLEKSSDPTFVVISSTAGSTGLVPQIPLRMGAYGQSKAAVNYVFAKLAQEHPKINIFVMHRRLPVHQLLAVIG